MIGFDDEDTQTFIREKQRATVAVADWGVATSLGHRRLENEDYWGNLMLDRFAVADGMGGTSGGMLAAQTTIEEFLAIDSTVGWVPELIQLNSRVVNTCRRDGFAAAGSTLVGLQVEEQRCVTVHIGDSRIYRLRNGILQQVTRDHNLRNLRLDEGLDPEVTDERGTPRALTSWVGAPQEPEQIDVATLSVEAEDRVILVSDGVSDQLSSDQISSITSRSESCTAAAQLLVDESDNAGGRDNATAIVVELGIS